MSVFGYENKNPVCIYNSKQTWEEHIHLLLELNERSCTLL